MPRSRIQHRLRKHADFQRAYKAAGRKQNGRLLAYFAAPRPPAAPSETPGPRVGLTVPRALGKAVDRNRIKRRMREAVRARLPLLEGFAVDVIFHPRRTVLDCPYADLDREVTTIFRSVASRHPGARS